MHAAEAPLAQTARHVLRHLRRHDRVEYRRQLLGHATAASTQVEQRPSQPLSAEQPRSLPRAQHMHHVRPLQRDAVGVGHLLGVYLRVLGRRLPL